MCGQPYLIHLTINCDILATCVTNRTFSVHYQCLEGFIVEDCDPNNTFTLSAVKYNRAKWRLTVMLVPPTTSGKVRGFWE